MIDLRRLEDPLYRAAILKKGVSPGELDALVHAELRRQEALALVLDLRARRNAVSKEIGEAPPDARQSKIQLAGKLKKELAWYEPELAAAESEVRSKALSIPNPAHESVPEGGEDDAEVLRTAGVPGTTPPLDHAEFGERIGFVNARIAARASGSRFAYLMKEAVLVELALVQWSLAKLVDEGFIPVVPPVLVREQTMVEAGFFPTDRQQVYGVGSAGKDSARGSSTDGPADEELFLAGTSEVLLSAIHADQILLADDLPLRYAGFSTCFRREAGTYGRDTRGIFRVHQFDKVEMFSFAHPDRSWEEHEELLDIEESMVRALGLPYRVVNIAAHELGAAAAKKYDIEVFLPSEGRYRELTSCSNYTDFSARRQGTRMRTLDGTRLVHTLNGTACAIARTFVFLFEHYQDSGGFIVPDVLRPYCGLERVDFPKDGDPVARGS